MIKILDFIDSLRESDMYIKDIYTQGGCYQFHLLLKKMYVDSIPFLNEEQNHVVTLYRGRLYDITGCILKPFGYLPLHEFHQDVIDKVKSWSFHKNNLISLGECQYCDEPKLYEKQNSPEPSISVVQDERSEYAKDVITQYISELAKAMNDKLEEDVRNGTIFRDTAKQPHLTEYKGFGTYCAPLRQI